jgi:hypothetical protein
MSAWTAALAKTPPSQSALPCGKAAGRRIFCFFAGLAGWIAGSPTGNGREISVNAGRRFGKTGRIFRRRGR